MKIGIIGAMPQETELLRDALVNRVDHVRAGRTYHCGTLHGKDAVVVFSRWGKVAASSTATTLIDRYNVDLIIFTGVAGAVHPDVRIGDVVVADRLIQHDFDVSATAMFPKFEIPFLGVSYLPVQKDLSDRAEISAKHYLREHLHRDVEQTLMREFCETSPSVHTGVIASGDQFIASGARLQEMREAIPGLLCVEMEGAAVAQVCYEHDVPFLVMRAISDNADHSAPIDFVRFVQHVASKYSYGIVRQLLEEL